MAFRPHLGLNTFTCVQAQNVVHILDREVLAAMCVGAVAVAVGSPGGRLMQAAHITCRVSGGIHTAQGHMLSCLAQLKSWDVKQQSKT